MDGRADRIDRRALLGMSAMGLGVFVIANDFTALSVALPAIEREFGANVTTVQWVMNVYMLVFGVLLVPGGRLADIFGRRRVFFAGTAIFAAFSVLGGLAPDIGWLIAARAVMGIGGALMWPAILGMTYELLPAQRAGLAGGLILGAAGLGNAVGPLLGGAVTDALSWRWILFLNLAVAAFAVAVTLRVVADAAAAAVRERIDYRGAAVLSTALVALLLALDFATEHGFGSARVVVLLTASAATLALFLLIERRTGASALIPRDVMANRDFRAACLAILLMSATFFSAVVFLPQFMVKSLGYSAFDAGLGLLPFLALFAATSFVAGSLYERLGPKLVLSLGAAGIAVGPLLLSSLEPDSGYAALVPGMLVLGLGIGFFYGSVTTWSVKALDPGRSSLAGGLVYMFQVAGGAVGLAVTTTVVTSVGRDSLTAGLSAGFLLDAALSLAGFLIVVIYVGGRLSARRSR